MCASSPPQPPDFTGAANAQGQSNITAAIVSRLLGNVNQNTPLGTQRFTQSGTTHVGGTPTTSAANALSFEDWAKGPGAADLASNPENPVDPQTAYANYKQGLPQVAGFTGGFDVPQFTSTTTLTPEQQKLLEQSQTNQLKTGGVANQLLGNVDTSKLDFSGAPGLSSTGDLNADRTRVSDALYGRATRYLDPQFSQAEDAERTRLANQGFQTGTEGFDKALGNFNLSKQRAYGDARDASIAMSGNEMSQAQAREMQARQQNISEILAARNQPINMISALAGGNQVSQPQFQPIAGGQGIAGAPIIDATAAQNAANLQNFGINSGIYNSQMGGLFGLGNAYLMSQMFGGAGAGTGAGAGVGAAAGTAAELAV